MTNTCKCKSESERMVECVRKLSETFHTTGCTAMIHIGMIGKYHNSVCVYFYADYKDTGTHFESVDAFEAWANSICDNPLRKIIHRRYDDILRGLR